MDIRDKVKGMFLGVAIGDALGRPAESMSAERVAQVFGRITDYQRGPALTTDDWQLTAATAEAMVNAGKIDLDTIAASHAEAYKVSVMGWGKTTEEAVARLVEGQSWHVSGRTDIPRRGTGNGVCMKVAPFGAYMALTNPQCDEPAWKETLRAMKSFARMTHHTRMGVQSAYCHAFATFKCLTSMPKDFNVESFIHSVVAGSMLGTSIRRDEGEGTDDLAVRLKMLYNHNLHNRDQIIEGFGGGTCYIFDSLPFTYFFFVQNPHSIDALYDCVSAGGDTDTNGSMLASLLGALHGPGIFPTSLVDGLQERDYITDLADRFCNTFSK